MCDADVGLIPMYWVKHHDHPYPDFSTKHKCRDYGRVWQWADENQVRTYEFSRVPRPDDAVELEVPP